MPKRIRHGVTVIRDVWLSVGIAVMVFCGAELTLYLRHQLVADGDIREHADAYGNANWVTDYFRELERSSRMAWTPYAQWRRMPFDGTYINVGSNGVRATLNAPACDSDTGTAKVFMFGGSAMWGTGARDTATIPSLVARALQQNRVSACVTNFGESGYVSTQEVIELLMLLRNGNVPDVVVFSDGYNDTFSAIQNGTGGLPQNEAHRRIEFNLSQSPRRLAAQLIRNTWLFYEATNIVALFSRQDQFEAVTPATMAEEVSRTYWANVRIVDALALQHGFKTLWYWQPVLLDKVFRSSFETEQAVVAEREIPVAFHHTVLAAVERNRPTGPVHFRFVAPLVANVHEPLFIDSAHLAETGNNLIAQLIASDILATLRR